MAATLSFHNLWEFDTVTLYNFRTLSLTKQVGVEIHYNSYWAGTLAELV